MPKDIRVARDAKTENPATFLKNKFEKRANTIKTPIVEIL